MDTKNLKRRHQTWYARVAVPPSLQPILGKAEIVRSLGTRDLREANRKKHRVLADITEMLTNATQERTLSKDDAANVMAVAKEARRSVRTGEQTPEQAQATLEHVLEAHLERMARKNGHDQETGDPLCSHRRTSAPFSLQCA